MEGRQSRGVGQVPYHIHTSNRDKSAHCPIARKDIPEQSDKPFTGCVGSLSLGKEVFWVQDWEELRDFPPETIFPNNNTYHLLQQNLLFTVLLIVHVSTPKYRLYKAHLFSLLFLKNVKNY